MDTVRATAKNNNQRSLESKTMKFQKHAQGADLETEARRHTHTQSKQNRLTCDPMSEMAKGEKIIKES